MTTVINTDIITAGTALSTFTTPALVDGDDLFITAGTLVASTANNAISSTVLDNYDIVVAGTVLGDATGIFLDETGTTTIMNYRVSVLAGGAVIGGTGTGVSLGPRSSSFDTAAIINNAGTIGSSEGRGVDLRNADIVTLNNSGHIWSNAQSGTVANAVYLSSSDSRFFNSGIIESAHSTTSTDIGDIEDVAAVSAAAGGATSSRILTFVNTGEISGGSHSLYTELGKSTVTNLGTMSGHLVFSTSASGNHILHNGGEIIGDAIFGTVGATGGTNDLVENWGVITGDVNTEGQSDTVVNSGHIAGDVQLGSGSDTFDGRGGSLGGTVSGGDGDDTYIIDDTGTQLSEMLDEGVDTVQINASYTLAENFENLVLLGSADVNGTGNDADNVIDGNAGDNRLSGKLGDDDLNGDGGNDHIISGGGKDTLDGGDGDDYLSSGGSRDTVTGGEGDDVLMGRSGNDRLVGDEGNDTLDGGSGEDDLLGKDGNDVLIGGLGQDNMEGGDGADIFVFNVAGDSLNGVQDAISDFTVGEDRVDLSALLGDAFTFNLLTGSFSGTGQEVRTSQIAGTTRVLVDMDGDGSTDMRIDLVGTIGVSEADFIL